MDALTDPAALRGFCHGEPEAVAEVVNACYPFLLNFLIRIGCTRPSAASGEPLRG